MWGMLRLGVAAFRCAIASSCDIIDGDDTATGAGAGAGCVPIMASR